MRCMLTMSLENSRKAINQLKINLKNIWQASMQRTVLQIDGLSHFAIVTN